MAFVTGTKMCVLIYLRVFSRGLYLRSYSIIQSIKTCFVATLTRREPIARPRKGNADAAKSLSSALAGSLISRRTGAAEALKPPTGINPMDLPRDLRRVRRIRHSRRHPGHRAGPGVALDTRVRGTLSYPPIRPRRRAASPR